jgi:hypothetical protein
MTTISILLILISIILLVLGLFSPALSLFWFQGDRTKKKSALIYIGLFFLGTILFSNSLKNKIDEDKEVKSSTASKLDCPYDFTNVEKAIADFNTIGIGEFSEWKSDMTDGFQSITPYYEYGETNPSNGLASNIAGYLTSKSENEVDEFVMELHINNPKTKTKSLERMSLSIEKLLNILNISNKEIITNIKLAKEFNIESTCNTITFKLDKSKIETYDFKIKNK